MAIKPKKQMPANKGETGGGAPRGSGGVKVIKSAPKPQRALENAASTFKTGTAKDGSAAKVGAKSVKTGAPKSTIKINSGKSNNKGFDKVGGKLSNDAKALKAANKGKKK